ncbi:hypothetical protein RZO50_02010 [Microbacterium sp. SSW1-59]|uniref:hypothetical protein n=1 Tax=Microbacterium xanthum TaxID=3079794 RepID=UPI002AD3278F|nr:hypothetical protein [Microbacterium sp. SSW1-59]MDZ8200272.1 hypothetical protein [Microbacterium sp. SSW1-59]
MSRTEIIKSLRSELVARGFVGRGRNLRVIRAEVAWMIQLELIPTTSRVGLSVGICPAALTAAGWPSRANNRPIILDPASGGVEMFGHDKWDIWHALDSDSALTSEARKELLGRLSDAIWAASEAIATLSDLRGAADAGKLSAFVRRDARALLER